MPAPETFVQILERVWWRLDRALDAETLRIYETITAFLARTVPPREHGGNCIKSYGDDVMVIFENSDVNAAAATAIAARIATTGAAAPPEAYISQRRAAAQVKHATERPEKIERKAGGLLVRPAARIRPTDVTTLPYNPQVLAFLEALPVAR